MGKYKSEEFNLIEIKYHFKDFNSVSESYRIYEISQLENYFSDFSNVLFIRKIPLSDEGKYCFVDKGFNIYFLGGFQINSYQNSINHYFKEKIDISLAYKLARFSSCYNSSSLFPMRIIDNANYDRLKQYYPSIKLPLAKEINNGYIFEIFCVAESPWAVCFKSEILIEKNGNFYHSIDTIKFSQQILNERN